MIDVAYRTLLGGIGAATRISGVVQPTIFCFHSVRSRGQSFRSSLSIDARFFESFVLSLRQLSVPILPIGKAIERIRADDMRPFAALTFDDGYRDNYTVLYPLMRRLRVPFTIFVTSGLVDGTAGMWWDALERLSRIPAAHAPAMGDADPDALARRFKGESASGRMRLLAELIASHPHIAYEPPDGPALDWRMLREMHGSGLLTVGSHTVSHPMLACLDEGEVQDELTQSRIRLAEMIDAPVDLLAYPFGQDWEVGPHAVSVAEKAGYKAAFSTEARPLQSGDAKRRFFLPRVLLSGKVRHPDIALAYMSGLPARLNRAVGRR